MVFSVSNTSYELELRFGDATKPNKIQTNDG